MRGLAVAVSVTLRELQSQRSQVVGALKGDIDEQASIYSGGISISLAVHLFASALGIGLPRQQSE